MTGRNHSAVERKIAKMGGTVQDIDRVDDEYPIKARSLRRKVGCSALMLLVVVLGIVIYWYRFNYRFY